MFSVFEPMIIIFYYFSKIMGSRTDSEAFGRFSLLDFNVDDKSQFYDPNFFTVESVQKDKSAKSRFIRTIFFRSFVYKDNLKFCLKKIFFGRRPKIFDKSSIGCALS